jgi:sarcosine oxidase subunit gamma
MLVARKAEESALALRVRERFQVELPQGPCRVATGELAFAGFGRGAWLVTHEGGDRVLLETLMPSVSDLGVIVDQSDGHVVLSLAGHAVRDTLGKLVPLDLHAHAFEVGAVACTVVAHIGTVLWRLDDCADGSPAFEIAVYRSFSEYFWRILSASV